MMNKVLENMLGKSVEQSFEEIPVEEVREKRQAEIDAHMKDKGKGVEAFVNAERSIVLSTDPESPIQNPVPISAVSAIFEEDVLLEDMGDDDVDGDVDDDDEENDDEEDDDDEKGGIGVTVTEASKEQNVDDYMHDDANEDHNDDVESEGENVDDKNFDEVEKLILRIEPDFKFDFEDELNAFDINQQPEYKYKYVDEADNYDRVEVEDCTYEDSVNEDTSEFPTRVEFFNQENRDELRRKVAEILKDKNFDGTTKDP
ncbi:hypothetical protein Hanom_Chr09g00794941 [Helianthus anomalus]